MTGARAASRARERAARNKKPAGWQRRGGNLRRGNPRASGIVPARCCEATISWSHDTRSIRRAEDLARIVQGAGVTGCIVAGGLRQHSSFDFGRLPAVRGRSAPGLPFGRSRVRDNLAVPVRFLTQSGKVRRGMRKPLPPQWEFYASRNGVKAFAPRVHGSPP